MANIKTLLAVELYEVTGKELTALELTYKNDPSLGEGFLKRDENEFNEILPEFFLDSDGELRNLDDFEWDNNDEKLILVNAWTADNLLQHEISAGGLTDMLDGINLNPFLEKLRKNSIKDLPYLCTYSDYLIVNLQYSVEDGAEIDIDDVLILNKRK